MGAPSFSDCARTRNKRAGSEKRRGKRSTELIMLKTAALAPMPRAKVAITARENAGATRSERMV